MRILLTFTFKGSLIKWKKLGLLHREIALYNKISEKNVNYRFLTYGSNKDLIFSDLMEKIEIIPIQKFISSKFFPISFLKSLLLPLKKKSFFADIDLIKTNQTYGSWIAYIPKILYRKKLIIRAGFEWLNGHISFGNKKGIKNHIRYFLIYTLIYFIEFFSYKLADGIILTNKHEIDFIVKVFNLKKKQEKNKIKLIYNYIDEELFKPLDIVKKDKSILYIGRLSHEKNLFNLVEALKDLKDFSLDIVGQGPEKEKLINKAKEFSINLNLLGVFPNEEIPKILNQYQIFILPSVSEGNPKVLLEAMSCGVPCIGTNVQGINNILTHKINGYLCNTNSKSIKNAILTLYNDQNLREKISKNARRFILENCSLTTIANKEFSFYQEILKK